MANATFICFNYKTRELCNIYSEVVAKSSIFQLTKKSCGSYNYNISSGCYRGIDDCECVWSQGSCNASYSEVKICGGQSSTTGTCTFSDDSSSECEGDITTIKWKATWLGAGSAPECKEGSKQILCRPTIKLPFFTLVNVIAVIALLIVIYYFFFIKKVYK